MLIVTIIPDCAIRHQLDDGEPPNSVLALPLGCGTVLDHLCKSVATIGSRDVWVVQNNSLATKEIRANTPGMRIRVMTNEELMPLLQGLEPSDLLVFINPQHWPADGFALQTLKQETMGMPGAVHAVAIGADRTGATEQVLFDEHGRVRRIRRFYAGVTQTMRHRGVVTHSLLPVAAMEGISFKSCSQLPVALAEAGVVSRDVANQTDMLDLAIPAEFLALSDRVLDVATRQQTTTHYSRLQERVLLGRGSLVHERATLRGPVIIQEGCTIEEGAVIIGPTVIGANSQVGRDAVVAQSALPAGSSVPAGTALRHATSVLRGDSGAPDRITDCPNSDLNDEEPAFAEFQSSQSQDHELSDKPAVSPLMLTCKRVVDVMVAIVALLCALPVMIVSAILIKLDSRGPLFFVHHREGRHGRPFPCLKFRTMTVDAHEKQRDLSNKNQLDGPHFKIMNDPRVTRIGKVLRKYNIDELPQIFNVLAGHMSLVGPRPSPFRENQYCIPWRRARLSVRPGVTGIWQICRSERHDGDFQQWIYYDMIYVRHMTPWLDLNILIATAFALATGREVPIHWIVKSLREGADVLTPHRHSLTTMALGAARGTNKQGIHEPSFEPIESA